MTKKSSRTEHPLAAALALALACAAPVLPTISTAQSESSAPEDVPAAPPDEQAARPEEVRVPVVEGAGGPHIGRHRPQHGGALVPLGEDTAHLEFVLDQESGMLTMHVLNGDASAPLPLPQEMVFFKADAGAGEFAIVLFAQPDESGDPSLSSHYAAGHHALRGATSFDAILEGILIDHQAFRRVRVTYPEGSEG